MQLGAIFPQTEFGGDAGAIKAYAQAVEGLGLRHVVAYDHVLGANPVRPGGWQGPYTFEDPFHEPFLLFSFMAAVTRDLSFATGILILPQRQSALVAKQAATLDWLSGGRFRLGVGVGWNPVEFEALGQDFHTRGRRIEEQVALLRRLWTERLVTFKGEWEQVTDAGIYPLPVQQPIPLWFGGHADAVLRRIARLGDGWFPGYRSAAEAQPALAALDRYLAEAGRSRADLGIEARLTVGSGTPEEWRALRDGWAAAGASHLSINTMRGGLSTPDEHLAALRRAVEALEGADA